MIELKTKKMLDGSLSPHAVAAVTVEFASASSEDACGA